MRITVVLKLPFLNVSMNLHLWLRCYRGVGQREGDAGGFRSEDVVFSLLCWSRCDSLAHVLVDDVTCSWERIQWLQWKSNSLVKTELTVCQKPHLSSWMCLWWNYSFRMQVNKHLTNFRVLYRIGLHQLFLIELLPISTSSESVMESLNWAPFSAVGGGGGARGSEYCEGLPGHCKLSASLALSSLAVGSSQTICSLWDGSVFMSRAASLGTLKSGQNEGNLFGWGCVWTP